MPNEGISRRDILRTLAVGAVGGSVLQVIPAEAAAYIHQMVHKEKAAAPAGAYTPKYFSASQYATLIFLCDAIIPKDEKSGGAVEAGAPEFIDLLTSENPEYQLKLGGGLFWLDAACTDRYGNIFMECTPEQKKEILDLIAFRKNAKKDPSLTQKRQKGPLAQPGCGLLCVPPQSHLRRLLHQQDRHRRPRLHWQHRPPRVPRLPATAGVEKQQRKKAVKYREAANPARSEQQPRRFA